MLDDEVLSLQVSHIYSGPLEDDDDADDELSQAMTTCDPEVYTCVCSVFAVFISASCKCLHIFVLEKSTI